MRMTDADMARQITTLSNEGLVELLKLSVEGENKKIDDVHGLAISGANQFEDAHQSGAFFSMIDRVLESAADRQYIDALIAELALRVKAGPPVAHANGPKPVAQLEASPGCTAEDKAPAAGAADADTLPPAAPVAKGLADRDRERLARQAMSYLLVATMEMHTLYGTSDQAYDLADKALRAIGSLRVMTQGGRVQT